MKSEDIVQQEIRTFAKTIGIHLWRNNNGALKDETGRPVRFGLGNDSKDINETFKSSDLIGLKEDDATFTAIEVKKEGWEFNPKDKREIAQKAYIDFIKVRGGIAGFAQSVDDFKKIFDDWREEKRDPLK